MDGCSRFGASPEVPGQPVAEQPRREAAREVGVEEQCLASQLAAALSHEPDDRDVTFRVRRAFEEEAAFDERGSECLLKRGNFVFAIAAQHVHRPHDRCGTQCRAGGEVTLQEATALSPTLSPAGRGKQFFAFDSDDGAGDRLGELEGGDRTFAVAEVDDQPAPIEQLRATVHEPRIERGQPSSPGPLLQGASTVTDSELLADGAALALLDGISFARTEYVPSSCRLLRSSRGIVAV